MADVPREDVSREVDDYMSMTFADPTKPPEKESSTQRRVRRQREAEARSRPKSKAQIAAAANAARDDALSTTLPTSSKGFQMMTKLGFTPGNALGAPTNANARTEPLGIAIKEDRGGVGMENEKKRKFREEAAAVEGLEKKQRAEIGDYRERIAKERDDCRVEGLCWGAMRVLEGLDQPGGVKKLPLKKINVLWRGLAKEREEKEREQRLKYDMQQHYVDPEVDEDDTQVLGAEEEDMEEEDKELDDFLALDARQRLKRLVEYLRAEYLYCFWCKCKYEDKAMDGCPGLEEDDHD